MNNLRKKSYIIILLYVCISATARAESEFEKFKAENYQGYAEVNAEFKEYKETLISAFNLYKKKVSKIWGDELSQTNSMKWQSFQGDLQHRSVVDFEKGQVDIAFVVDKNEVLSAAQVNQRLQNQISKLLKQGLDARSIQEISSDPVSQSSGASPLKGLINIPQSYLMSEESALVVDAQKIVGDDGNTRIMYRTRFELLPDHIHRRAIKYESIIDLHSNKYKIASELIFAIMETESMFNPTARSPVPAFGLMQLVPNSGAREAYRYVYKADKIVTDTYLYNPEKNIELGAAYINRLYYRYLSAIKDPISRQWASVAAYNTGVGNVFRVFAGRYSSKRFASRKAWRKSAFYEINKIDSEKVFELLESKLPYKETRLYIKKVRQRMTKYKS